MAEFYLLGNATHSQMMGCVIHTERKTIVIDGGSPGDYVQLAKLLEELANFHVDAWFFTHPHGDHVGAFNEICLHYPELQIDNVFYRFPNEKEILLYGDRGEREVCPLQQMRERIKEAKIAKQTLLNVGDEFLFDDVRVTVLRVYNPNITSNFCNNSSAVFRIENQRHSFLILGDLGVEGGKEVIKTCKKESLQADYTQMAHHGQNGVNRAFYEYIQPKACLWCTPQWLWDNDAGEGFDTGPWATVSTRTWLREMGVTRHFIAKDGTQKITF